MYQRARFWWDKIRTGFWFVPALIAVGSFAASIALVMLDRRIGSYRWSGAWWLYGGGAEGARAVLSAIASSMITVAGVVFSIMMVVLSLAAQQYGPRLLRNIMRDQVTQSMLGVFVATFLYCLMVLRTIRGGDDEPFVPQVAVSVGVGLALFSLAVLIYFIHHVSVSIHISEIIERVQDDLLSSIDSLFPETLGQDVAELDEDKGMQQLPSDFEREAEIVKASSAGYVEALDDHGILSAATDKNLILRLEVQPGDFLLPDQTLMLAWPAGKLDDETRENLQEAVITGYQRTPLQDVLYAFEQQTDLAIRALSPGINDPFTAINCVDRLGEALARLAERRFPSATRFDEDQHLRVIVQPFTYGRAVEVSLGYVRQFARTQANVTIRILEVLGRLSEWVHREADRDALAEQLAAIARDEFPELTETDRSRVRFEEGLVRERLS